MTSYYDTKHRKEVKIWSKMKTGHFVVESKFGELYTVRPEYVVRKKCECKCENCTCK